MMRAVMDRWEGDFAVCEGEAGEMMEIPRSRMPSDAEPGVTLLIGADGISVDWDDTRARRERIAAKRRRLWKR